MTADHDVLVVGAGVAGLSAAVYTARAGFSTLVLDGGDPILRRNAHLENFPGFPAGVNPRQFLDLLVEQAARAGCTVREGRVTGLTEAEGGFEAHLDDGTSVVGERAIAASWSDCSYLSELDVDLDDEGKKTYVTPDPKGRTSVDGLYAAGRIAAQYHQTVVAAGHGATAALTLVHDSDEPFYHDWVAPEGYFTDRGRDVPPGCEEIDEEEQRRREEESMRLMRERFSEPHPDPQQTHPSLVDD